MLLSSLENQLRKPLQTDVVTRIEYEYGQFGSWYIKSVLYKKLLPWNKVFKKYSSFWENCGLWDKSVLYSLFYLA